MTINGYELMHTMGGTQYKFKSPDGQFINVDALGMAGLFALASSNLLAELNKIDSIEKKLDGVVTMVSSFSKQMERSNAALEKLSTSIEKIKEGSKTKSTKK